MEDRTNQTTTPVKTTTEARGAVTGHNVRYVLMLGLGAAVLCLGIVLVAFFRA